MTAKDRLAPTSNPADALVGELGWVTLITCSLEETLLFYRDGMGLTATGPEPVPDDLAQTQRQLWGIPEPIGWQQLTLERPGLDLPRIRVLVLDRVTPSIHSSWDLFDPGPFSIGFPNEVPARLDRDIRRTGFGAVSKEMAIYPVPRGDGSFYDAYETILNAPDFVHGVSLHRGGGMPQIGPVDDDSGMGGPAYSGMVLVDSDKDLSFYTEVLGYEMRSDGILADAPPLNAPPGTRFRFTLLYSPGAIKGSLLSLDFVDLAPRSPAQAPRPPHRGLAIWSFPTRDLDEVLRRAEQHPQAQIFASAQTYSGLAGTSPHRTATLLAPNGFMVELYEKC